VNLNTLKDEKREDCCFVEEEEEEAIVHLSISRALLQAVHTALPALISLGA
jgi:hypothetical protein